MMKSKVYGHKVIAALAMGVLMVALSACEKSEGPAEHAGKEIDNAIDKTGQQLEKAGDKVRDAAKGEEKN